MSNDWQELPVEDAAMVIDALAAYPIGAPGTIRENSAAKVNRVFCKERCEGYSRSVVAILDFGWARFDCCLADFIRLNAIADKKED
ncbi:MAG TPA: hypothetical protein VLC46_21915 [Thermoanaerobaculia bacterium]|jgi:hypothetical protein|nr:hypothetical protein [Thermoanaerobaculia bacterium]